MRIYGNSDKSIQKINIDIRFGCSLIFIVAIRKTHIYEDQPTTCNKRADKLITKLRMVRYETAERNVQCTSHLSKTDMRPTR